MPEQDPEHPALVWFRQDLRLADNPALQAACAGDRPVVALFVLDDETPGVWRPGGASRWWLHHSLAALEAALEEHGVPLLLRRGDATQAVAEAAADVDATAVYWNRCYEPFAVERDRGLKKTLGDRGLEVGSRNAALLSEPWELKTGGGTPYKVFTPFWKALRVEVEVGAPDGLPRGLRGWRGKAASDDLDAWNLLPHEPDWATGLRATWTPGEAGARARMRSFVDSALADYAGGRDRPAINGTSGLSPHLHWGEIGPRQAWHWAREQALAEAGDASAAEPFLRELGWREFCAGLLYHNPAMPERPLRPEFADFPWRDDDAGLEAWRRGRTGYPLVDAGMRQLWETGWMHNRVRMVVASLLIKHLLVPWQRGEDWFWDTLVDADLASNAANWQWVAGCGADAAPFFRIFNPVSQGRKFDPEGDYVRRWVPELAELPASAIHVPWEADAGALSNGGVRLGETYPRPVVDHGEARKRALAAFQSIKE